MKKLLLLALLASFTAHAQTGPPSPNDNLVLVQTPDSAVAALKKLAVAFVAQGYKVAKLDTQFLTLTLKPKILRSSSDDPLLLVKASAAPGANSTLTITAEYQILDTSPRLNGYAEIRGNERGAPLSSFRALQKVALTYPAGQVSYGKQ